MNIDMLTDLVGGQPFQVLLPVALILIMAKVISIVLSKFKIPQVIGFLIAGLLIGLVTFIPGETILTGYTNEAINILAKFGVVLILFSAGVETNIKQIKSVGKVSVIITLAGVLVPLAFGFGAASLFRIYGGLETSFLDPAVNPIYSDIYYGVILTATSVSITVATLKELGKLEGKVGNAIVAAAIIDDIIGIILLSLIISLSGTTSAGGNFNLLAFIIESCGGVLNSATEVIVIVCNMLIFFGLSVGAYFAVRPIFNWLGKKYPHHIRIPILSLAFCFLWAYIAQAFFQIADITGAYIAGLILAGTRPASYIDHRTETTANVFFIPIFFSSVALKMYSASFDFTDWLFIVFGLVWVVLGALGKVIGAGCGALIGKFKMRDSLKVGVGMMARAEVLIVTAQTGVDAHLVSSSIIPFTLILILVTSFLTPILLKILYKNEKPDDTLKLTDHRQQESAESQPVESK